MTACAPAPNPATTPPNVSRTPSAPARRLLVDAPTRLFHALFALSFTGAFLTAESEHWRRLHVSLGYLFGGLLVARLLYGLMGPRQARLGLLWRRVSSAPAWLRTLLAAGRADSTVNWRQGQNLAMGMALVGLLTLAAPLVISGYGSHADWDRWLGGDALSELHEALGNLMLGLVLLHLGLVILLSLLRRQNLAAPMLTGRGPGTGPSPVQHNRVGLAIGLLVVVVAFGVWRWLDAPPAPSKPRPAVTADIVVAVTPPPRS